ncbi:trigger factor [SAR202 cluster bacterium AC-409-J13_OGT_754m]|nr:trigger factor [SAR202 cluster bacterium AC-409-J13_OGT_754m]
MNITRDESLPIEANILVELEEQDIEPYLDRGYRKVVSKVRVPGFRPGKAPRTVIERMLGRDQLIHEVLDRLIAESVDLAVEKEGITPFATPAIELINLDPISFKAKIPLEPQVDLGSYLDIRLDQDIVSIEETHVDDAIERIRISVAPWEPVERAVEFDDLVTLDVHGSVEGKVIIDQKGIDYIPSADNNLPIPGFAEQLQGIDKDGSKSFGIIIPEDFGDPEMAGKECEFFAKINGIKHKMLAELDDEFAKGVGEGYETFQQLRDSIRDNLSNTAQNQADQEFQEKLLQEVISVTTMEFSDVIVEREIDRILDDQEESLKSQRMDMDTYLKQVGKTQEEVREELDPVARDRIKRSLVLRKLSEEQKIEVLDEEVDEGISKMLMGSGEVNESFRRAIEKDSFKNSFRSSIVTSKTFERLMAIAKGEKENNLEIEKKA